MKAKKGQKVSYTEAKLKEILAFMRAGNSTTAVYKKYGMSSQWAGRLRKKHKIAKPTKRAKPTAVKKTVKKAKPAKKVSKAAAALL